MYLEMLLSYYELLYNFGVLFLSSLPSPYRLFFYKILRLCIKYHFPFFLPRSRTALALVSMFWRADLFRLWYTFIFFHVFFFSFVVVLISLRSTVVWLEAPGVILPLRHVVQNKDYYWIYPPSDVISCGGATCPISRLRPRPMGGLGWRCWTFFWFQADSIDAANQMCMNLLKPGL